MIVTSSLADIKGSIGAVCLGSFDGVHLGHRQIFGEAVAHSKLNNKLSAVFTFYPHPGALTGRGVVSTITTREQRARLIAACGIDLVIEHPFTLEFSKLSPRDFVTDVLLDRFGPVQFVAGFNYSFGHKALGTIETLLELGSKYNFGVTQVPPVLLDGEVVSSTRVRKYIQAGDLAATKRCLGRYFSLSGKVVHGDKRGRNLGYPTANIHFASEQLLPPNGVYLLRSPEFGIGVANLGIRPTFPQHGITLEVHFINRLDRDLYNEELEVEIIGYLRPEQEFHSTEDLRAQIAKDIARGLEMAKYLDLD